MGQVWAPRSLRRLGGAYARPITLMATEGGVRLAWGDQLLQGNAKGVMICIDYQISWYGRFKCAPQAFITRDERRETLRVEVCAAPVHVLLFFRNCNDYTNELETTHLVRRSLSFSHLHLLLPLFQRPHPMSSWRGHTTNVRWYSFRAGSRRFQKWCQT